LREIRDSLTADSSPRNWLDRFPDSIVKLASATCQGSAPASAAPLGEQRDVMAGRTMDVRSVVLPEILDFASGA